MRKVLLFLLLICIWYLYTFVVASTGSASNLTTDLADELPPLWSTLGRIWIWIIPISITAIVTHYIDKFLVFANIEKRVLNRIKSPPELLKDQCRNIILLLGVGGTGKTTLIRRILESPQANPSTETDDYYLYTATKTIDVVKTEDIQLNRKSLPIQHIYHCIDYMGQDIGSMVKGFIASQVNPHTPVKAGYINSVIFVVDLYPAGEFHNDTIEQQPKDFLDRDRITHHISNWSPVALDAVFGFVGAEELKYVCLFINKRDLLALSLPDEQIINEFAPLIREIQKKLAGVQSVKFDILIGSAKQDSGGTRSLKDRLYQEAVC